MESGETREQGWGIFTYIACFVALLISGIVAGFLGLLGHGLASNYGGPSRAAEADFFLFGTGIAIVIAISLMVFALMRRSLLLVIIAALVPLTPLILGYWWSLVKFFLASL